jgi:hypothetical protein
MHRFFDDSDDFALQLTLAERHVMPILDLIDGDSEKIKTALFVLFTKRAIENNGLRRARAHAIIDVIFDEADL